jgi:hypothetical protein
VEDEQVRELAPALLWEESHQVTLDASRVIVPRQPEPAREPADMRVDDNAFIDAEHVPEHHVRGLAGDATQRRQRLHRLRHLAAMPIDQRSHGLGDGARLHPPEVERPDVGRDPFGARARIVRGCGERAEEARSGSIDAHIGGLRRQDGGHQQLVRCGPRELAVRIGVSRAQGRKQRTGARTLRGRLAR